MTSLKYALAALLGAFSVHAAALGSLVDITVFDRSEGRRLPIYWHEGRAYVVGKPGNEYQLSLRSRQGEDVLAVLSVDGINVITGETATTQQSGYVLSPWRPFDVKGWRKDLSRTAAFYFTALPDSYAARTGRPDNVGAIGVALFRRKAPERVPFSQVAPAEPQASPFARSEAHGAGSLADKSAARAMERDREDRLGTGHGRSEVAPARHVGFERATREPAEVVTIYYDRYENLLARGIVPRTAWPRPTPGPNPFPGFVPDPPA